ncbi:DUF2268 domain-containing putative Zn-dependent protease [Microbispora bryophytorum]|uniref:DUF2268 domain-containing putative Zn-dependent protease n=1 Tax=Microbispora bryophytorum TaxID=1460882 RepID=UPI001CC2BA64|nr:DUF2268 domain-containing putative Zn-dependent protease [Microbispora camponoti]
MEIIVHDTAAAMADLPAAPLAERPAALTAAWKHRREAVPGIRHPETLQVYLVLGDPDAEHLVRRNHGCLGMSGRGLVHLLVWPTEENVGRLGHCAVHELNHNIRYSNVVWGDPAAVTCMGTPRPS